MAQRLITQLIDDLDGKELTEGAGETVTFALDGISYEIDLGKKNADKFRGLFQDYVASGRRVSRKQGGSKRTQSGPSAAEVREWARSSGLSVPDRGRIPAEVRDAYEAKG